MTAAKPVITVTQLNTYVRAVLEQDAVLKNVFVTGEISNFTNHYRTGHLYMSLKDDSSVIKAVMFRSSAERLKFTPENGMKVLCRGRVSLYERDGAYQLYIEDMQPDGAGALAVAYEQLKKKLEAEGIFSQYHKLPIPQYPKKIAVITSPTGAAVRDIFNVLSRRWPIAEIIMCPVQVQGEAAAGQLTRMVKRVDALSAADVIIIGRGGGSVEDLWAFNSEALARAVYDCSIPVISAVGHETDFTICDFAADLRAPTPSAAAELVVPDAAEISAVVCGYKSMLKSGLIKTLESAQSRLLMIENLSYFREPSRLFERREMEFDRLTDRMDAGYSAVLSAAENRFNNENSRLNAFSPLSVLGRGYACAEIGGKLVTEAKKLKKDDLLTVCFSDGKAFCKVEKTEIQRSKKEIKTNG